MRNLLLVLTTMGLVQCAYYGDLHSESTPLTSTALTAKHTYRPPNKLASSDWWQHFHDPALNQLIQMALTDSPSMQIAKARIRAAQQLKSAAATQLFPSIDLSGYAQREKFSQFGLVPPPFNGHIYNIGTLGLNFNYEFDFWGKNRQLIAARVNEECATIAEYAEVRLILSTSIANAYFNLAASKKQTMIANEYWQMNQQLLRIATQRTQHGIESNIPVKTIEAKAQAAKLTLEQYRLAEYQAQHQLAGLLGKNALTTKIITTPFNFHRDRIKLPNNISVNILSMRPDIFAAKARVEAAAHKINVAKARFFPNINLSALFSYQSVGFNRLFNVESQNNAITGAIDLPIFDAGLRRANLGLKYAEYDIAVNQYNQTILKALEDVANQSAALETLGNALQAQQTAYDASYANNKLFTARFKHGIADEAQVIDSKRILSEREATLIHLQTRYIQANVMMYRALGGNDHMPKDHS